MVGWAFVHGLNDAISLLGPLPKPWRVQVFDNSSGDLGHYLFFNSDTGVLSEEDPRLGPLGDRWKRVSKGRTADDPATFQCFADKDTGETINHDPRMSPEALKARGADIRTFTLI